MKKYFSFAAFVLLATVMTFPLVSCGNDDDNNGNEPQNQTGNDDSNNISGMENGYAYVDLGLPSGTMWAYCNVGAGKSEAYGSYFAWGETEPKSDYSWDNYKWGDWNELTRYCTSSEYGKDGYRDVTNPEFGKALTELLPEDDAARAKWGGKWRMPTQKDFEELIAKAPSTWTDNYKNTGVKGRIFTGSNGKSIFLPAANIHDGVRSGDYWTSTLFTSMPFYAIGIYFGKSNMKIDSNSRYVEHTIRPVFK